MKKYITALLLILCHFAISYGQERNNLNMSFEARGDYQRTYIGKKNIKNQTGFEGNIINFILNGDISPKFSFAFRQRLSGINQIANFFDATDWMYLTYKASERISLSGGKQIVYVGGWELDTAPIDCYFLSAYAYHLNCYQWGVSMNYIAPGGNDEFIAQLCQSPFRSTYTSMTDEPSDMYSYNIVWMAKHSFFEPIWSFNIMEYRPGRYINYISLGNKFHLSSRMQLEFDYMNRATKGHTFLASDYTLVCQVSFQPNEKLNLFAKASYDVNNSGTNADYCVFSGTQISRFGAGLEYFPLKDKRVRIHGNYSYSMGTNTNPNAVLQDQLSLLNFGLTWRLKVL